MAGEPGCRRVQTFQRQVNGRAGPLVAKGEDVAGDSGDGRSHVHVKVRLEFAAAALLAAAQQHAREVVPFGVEEVVDYIGQVI